MRATLLKKLSDAQKNEQQGKEEEKAEEAARSIVYKFFYWFEDRFKVKRAILKDYSVEELTELFRIFEEQYCPNSLIGRIIQSDISSALGRMRGHYGEEYIPTKEIRRYT